MKRKAAITITIIMTCMLVAFSNRISLRLNQPAAAQILAGSEFMFRSGMVAYGNLFTGSDPAAVFQNLVLYLQVLAAQQGIQIEDPGLVALVLAAGVTVIQNDYAGEILAAIPFAAYQLARQGVAF